MTRTAFSPASYSLRNQGPWPVVSIDEWGRFGLGQSTALSGAAPSSFQEVDRRNLFLSLFPVSSVHEADQVHGAGLADVPAHSSGQLRCDGLTTARPSVMLTMRTADCYPVFLKDAAGHRFGIVHAGWRGLRERIVHRALTDWFDGPVDVLVGAGIDGERYEVSDDVVSEVLRTHDTDRSTLSEHGVLSGQLLDLAALIRWQCQTSPRSLSSLARLPLTTGEDQPVPMYSYRESATENRMVSWIFKQAS